MFRGKNPPTPTLSRVTQSRDAVFIGWQKTSWGEIIGLYNITAAGHPSYGSTVTEKTLRKMHLRTPRTAAMRGTRKSGRHR
jgi:hypothetical protein